jgi:hypothetical protein
VRTVRQGGCSDGGARVVVYGGRCTAGSCSSARTTRMSQLRRTYEG